MWLISSDLWLKSSDMWLISSDLWLISSDLWLISSRAICENSMNKKDTAENSSLKNGVT